MNFFYFSRLVGTIILNGIVFCLYDYFYDLFSTNLKAILTNLYYGYYYYFSWKWILCIYAIMFVI